VRRIVFCSGKIYYDLLAAREEQKIDDVALLRIEQLYPFPRAEYETAIRAWPAAREVVWCQEEPENQGAWYQIKHRLRAYLDEDHRLLYATREGTSSTATGYAKAHQQEQKAVVEAALRGACELGNGA
jgi:2-oxoglutarate dehydrogenase E1 component (EC 1.2.4.2)